MCLPFSDRNFVMSRHAIMESLRARKSDAPAPQASKKGAGPSRVPSKAEPSKKEPPLAQKELSLVQVSSSQSLDDTPLVRSRRPTPSVQSPPPPPKKARVEPSKDKGASKEKESSSASERTRSDRSERADRADKGKTPVTMPKAPIVRSVDFRPEMVLPHTPAEAASLYSMPRLPEPRFAGVSNESSVFQGPAAIDTWRLFQASLLDKDQAYLQQLDWGIKMHMGAYFSDAVSHLLYPTARNS